MARRWTCIDGNEAAARVAHALAEVVAIYPITPASAMGEHADAWSAAGRQNLWGSVPEVVEMQSEAGAAGALHGAATKGALATTFTSSQGLLLMLPNMFKLAGELTPTVIHVAARAIATHALSIFGDHSDVMAARSTGWAMLSSSSVQEAHDFALIAHAATLRSRVPFLHFFDGFRTSHEINKIELLDDADLKSLVREDDVLAHRLRGLSPDHPVLRGSAQNPDVFFQAREAANPFYADVPGIVQGLMDELDTRTGRAYHLVDYIGAEDAEDVIVIIGSGLGAVSETVKELVRRGSRVGALVVRLYRPFPTEALVAALPVTVRRIAVLDRTKEPGGVGEPLYLDVVAALAEQGRRDIDVIGGRYGLASKEFTPQMVKGVYDELAGASPRRHVTVGIIDDVTHTSVSPDRTLVIPTRALQAVFYGLGSDGTVGANQSTVKIIGEHTDQWAQGYFVYDSKKSGAVTVSHLRFSPDPIVSTYLVDSPDFVACHQFGLLKRLPVLATAREGATFLLNAPFTADEVWEHLPADVQEQIIDKRLRFFVIDAHRIAREGGLATRINTVMQPCFFALTDVLPLDQAIDYLKSSIEKVYGKRGREVVEHNLAVVDLALTELTEVKVPQEATATWRSMAELPLGAPDFVRRVTERLMRGEGDLLPVSALPVDGEFPTDTARWEKPAVAQEIPVWDETICIDCGKCAIICPHAAIRMKVFGPDALTDAPGSFTSKPYNSRDLPSGTLLSVQVAPDDCTGCGLCVEICPAASKDNPAHKSLNLVSALKAADLERPKWEFFEQIPEVDRTAVRHDTVKGSQLLQPLFEFSGACSGCGETPYLKLLSQLFGDRMIVANATGCSSIYGGNLPSTPWAQNADGRGPAWSNSLFEDNAEFGLGMLLAHERQQASALELLTGLGDVIGQDLVTAIVSADQSDEAGLQAQRSRVVELKAQLAASGDDWRARHLLTLADELVSRSLWIVGGDGWAYDIGYGGLDHVLGSGRNVNILVLDTEVYSNTGGQASKSTPRAATAKFAVAGKQTAKKDLGVLAMAYGDVYVAQIAMGANEMQTTRALLEAEAWPGPSLVIAYSPCIAHGIELSNSLEHQGAAVASGYWPLYRYHPSPEPGSRPFRLDSKPPSIPVRSFTMMEGRFTMLGRSDPARARHLLALAQADVDERWHYYEQLAGVERTLTQHKDAVDLDVPEP